MNGGEITFMSGKVFIKMNGTVIAVGHRYGNLYFLKLKLHHSSTSVNLASTDVDVSTLWHRRLGHLSMPNVCHLINHGLAVGVKDKMTVSILFCEPCVKGKLSRLPFSSTKPPTVRPLQRVRSDVSGKMPIESVEGNHYYVTFIDNFTHMTVTYLLSRKSEVFEKFKTYHSMATTHFNVKMECLRSDSGGEYLSYQFTVYVREHGIRHECNVPYNPELNGVAERMNRTIMGKARTMLVESDLPKNMWSEAVMAATYLINRSPTTVLKNKTPFEMWSGMKPDISRLRVFGSRVFAHIPKEKRHKLDDRCYEA